MQKLTFGVFNANMQITGTELHLLAVFDSVVRNSGFSAAQAELGLSQPTISNHITALEQRLGVKLCQRGRRGFLLTEKGRIVHELSQSLLSSIEEHSTKLAELKGNLVGHLRIAVVDCLSTDENFRAPQAIRAFNAIAPAVTIEMSVERPQEILTGLIEGRFHAGIGGFDNFLSGLDYRKMYTEQHAAYCGVSHPLFEMKKEEALETDLTSFPWVHRGYWSRQRQRHRPSTGADCIVKEIEAQLVMVLSGCYVGLLPKHAAEMYVRENRLRELPHDQEEASVAIYVVTKNGPLPLVIQNFVDLQLREYGIN